MPTESCLRISLPGLESAWQTCSRQGSLFLLCLWQLTTPRPPWCWSHLHAPQYPQDGHGPAGSSFPDPKCLEFILLMFWVFKRENYQPGLCLTWWCRILADFRFTHEALKIPIPGLNSYDSFQPRWGGVWAHYIFKASTCIHSWELQT